MKSLFGAAGLLIGCLVLACGGSGESPPATLAPPPIDPRLRALAQGVLTLAVEPGASRGIDVLATTGLAPDALPACADGGILFSWRAQPPESVRFVAMATDRTSDIAQGKAGQASVGSCAALEVVNPGGRKVEVEVRYFVVDARR